MVNVCFQSRLGAKREWFILGHITVRDDAVDTCKDKDPKQGEAEGGVAVLHSVLSIIDSRLRRWLRKLCDRTSLQILSFVSYQIIQCKFLSLGSENNLASD